MIRALSAGRASCLIPVAFALVIAAVQSAPAPAQLKPEPRLGSRIPVSPEQLKSDKARQLLREFAACLVQKRRALASAFILDRSVFRFDDKYGHLADGECLDPASALADEVALKLDPESMRYAIAEALLRDELASIDPSTISRAPPVPIPVVFGTDPSEEAKSGGTGRKQKTSDEERASDLAKIIMYKFGDCTVRVNPMASQAMLQAAPDTAAEGAAIQLLMPALGSCLEKGTQVTLNRTRLRGAVALSYYSLAHASAAQKGSSASPQH